MLAYGANDKTHAGGQAIVHVATRAGCRHSYWQSCERARTTPSAAFVVKCEELNDRFAAVHAASRSICDWYLPSDASALKRARFNSSFCAAATFPGLPCQIASTVSCSARE